MKVRHSVPPFDATPRGIRGFSFSAAVIPLCLFQWFKQTCCSSLSTRLHRLAPKTVGPPAKLHG
jgi:hypothetical protein